MPTSIATALHRFKRAAVPLSKHMVANAIIDRLTGYPEPEVAHLSRLVSSRRIAVDIGANSGYYTCALAKLFRQVWCFEPNPGASRPIAAARLKNVRLENVALSSKSGRATLRVPVVAGQTLDGWGSLCPNTISQTSIELNVKTASLDSYELSEVDFIKIDVEGHEADVFEGALKTIARCKPVCLVETDCDGVNHIEQILRPMGYSRHRTWNGVVLSNQNNLLVPISP